LAIVLIYRSTDVINFAQGEMAMFATFMAWSIAGPTLFDRMPVWLVLVLGVAVAAFMGGVIERVFIRPVEDAPVLSVVVVTLGLFLVLNSLAMVIYGEGDQFKAFPTPFGFESVDLGIAKISRHHLGILITAIVLMIVLFVLFRYTKIGLGMRATAQNKLAARLMGINVGRMLTVGWALAAGVGGLAGMLIAPVTTLHPGFMLTVLLFGFAAAVLGGLNSAPGAILGGFIIGVTENMLGTYTSPELFGPEMKLPLTLLLLVIVLLVKPTGLLGQPETRRV